MPRYTFAGLTVPQVTVIIGILMSVVGLTFFGFTDYLTALFPSLFGIILVASGTVSIYRPEYNALSMHFAVLASFLSALLGFSTVIFGSWTTAVSLIEQLMMSSLASTHLSVCIAAFAYGRSDESAVTQACGINTRTSLEKASSPVPATVVAISMDR